MSTIKRMIHRWIFLLLVPSLVTSDIITVQWFVDEESPAKTLIGNIRQALHSKVDAEVLSQSQFNLLSRPNQNLDGFTIDRNTGDLLTTTTPLDREAICPLSRSVECLIDLSIGLFRSAQLETLINVKVLILDVNDNPPVFSQEQYEVRISELSTPGTTLALPVATDLDSPRFGIQTYRLRSNFQEFQLKLINSSHGSLTPHLTLTKQLQLEPEPYSLLLEAFDWGTPSMSGSTTILVTVEDANDHPPTFSSETVEVQVLEDHPVDTAIYRVTATDGDRGLNSEISYMFVPATTQFHGHNFRLDKTSGEIFLKKSLDFETENSFQLDVMAVDSGVEPLTGHQTIIVQVKDVNDNSPQLTINTLTSHSQPRDHRGLGAEVLENAPAGSFVAHVSVYDADSGENGQVSCQLLDESVHFSLDLMAAGQYKLTTLAEVDYETDHAFVVTVECSDNGQPMMTRRQNVTIGVVDLNDNAPEFLEPFFNVTVPESNLPDARILQVKAKDRDSGINSQLVYSIVEPYAAQLVYVDSNTSTIRASGILDYETLQKLNFTVLVMDSGKPVHSASAQVTINIEDVNDEEPRFLQNTYEFSVPENSPPGTVVGFVSAVDRDSPPFNQFVYKIVDAFSSGVTDLFAIDPRSGKIIAKRSFDRESKSEYHCTVSAIDQEKPSLRSEAMVQIRIEDENDNYPVIVYPPPLSSSSSDDIFALETPVYSENDNKSFAVSNAVPRGFTILRVIARDPDEGENARLTYGLANANDIFTIDPRTGAMATDSEFHEVTHARHIVRITVHDSGYPAKTSAVDVAVVIDASIPFEDMTTSEARDGHEFGARVPSSRGGGSGEDEDQTTDSNHLFIIIIAVSCAVAAILILILIVVSAVKVFERRSQPHAVYHCREQERKVLDKIAANSFERKETEELEKQCSVKPTNSTLSINSQRMKRDGNSGNTRDEGGGGSGNGGLRGEGAGGVRGMGRDGKYFYQSIDYAEALERKLLRELRENEMMMMAEVDNSSLTDVSGDSGLGTSDETHRFGFGGSHLPTPISSHQSHHHNHHHHHHHLHDDPPKFWHEDDSRQSYSLPRNNGIVPPFASTFKGLSQSTTQIVLPPATIPHYDDYESPLPLPPTPSAVDEEETLSLIGGNRSKPPQYCAQPQMMMLCPLNNNVAKDGKNTKRNGDSLVDEIRKYKTRMAKFPAHSSALREQASRQGQTRHLFRESEYGEEEDEEEEGYEDCDVDDLSLRWEGVR